MQRQDSLPLFADQDLESDVGIVDTPRTLEGVLRGFQDLRQRAHELGLDTSPLDGWLARLFGEHQQEDLPAFPRLTIEIPGEPFAQPRARAVPLMRGGQPVLGEGGRPVVTFYDDPEARSWKAGAQEHMRQAVLAAGLSLPFIGSGPVYLEINAYWTCLKSDRRKTQPRGLRRKWTRPDEDNMTKAVKDAGKGVLWLDDSQVCDGPRRKFFAPQDHAPKTVIRIWALPEEV